MSSSREINRVILEQVSLGRIDENTALVMIKKIQGIQEKKSFDIAIIGMECRFPGAADKYEFWDNLKNGVYCSRNFPKERARGISHLTGKRGCAYSRGGYLDSIDMFDPSFFRISPREALMMDPFQRVFLEVAYSAIEDAGYGGSKINNSSTGVFVGVDTSNKHFYMYVAGDNDFLTLTGSMNSIIASRLSYIFNLRGPAMAIDTACSSGLVALHEACSALKNGDCEMAIAGGINLLIVPNSGGTTSDMTSDDGETRAFDRNGNGFSWGEGAGAVLLKPLEKAIRDRDNIYAVIKGSAVNNDGSSNGITAPNPDAQTEVILKAWKEAGIDPQTLSYIEAHGTGTALGDPIEIRGLTDAFSKYTDKRQFCGIGSTKTNIGHTIGASGIASLIKVTMSLKYGVIPATLNFVSPNPGIDFSRSPVFVNTKPRKWETSGKVRRAGINSFGACGTNCHVVVEEAGDNIRSGSAQAADGMLNVLTISAKSTDAFKRLIQRYILFLDASKDVRIQDMCYTANTGRGHYMYRAAVLFSDLQDLKQKLIRLSGQALDDVNIKDVYYGEHKLVRAAKKDRASYEITEGERHELGYEAADMLVKYVDTGRTSDQLLYEICKLYVKGAVFDWDGLYNGLDTRRISLPVYPFDRVRCWVDIPEGIEETQHVDQDNVFYRTKWVAESMAPAFHNSLTGAVILIKDRGGMGTELAEAFRCKGITVLEVETGDAYSYDGRYVYTVNGSEDDYARLFEDAEGVDISGIIHMGTVRIKEDGAKDCFDLDETLRLGAYELWGIIRALSKSNVRRKLDIVLISDHVNEVTANERILKPENATLFGFGKIVVTENSNIQCRCIDIDANTDIDSLVREIENGYSVYSTAYRDGTRYIEVLQRVDMSETSGKALTISKDKVYVITGGAGGIGIEIGKYLADKEKVSIALIGRSTLPERAKWDEILNSGTDKGLSKKLKGIRDIEAKGAAVTYYSADVSDYGQISSVINEIRRDHGRIAGVFHCAGVPGDKIIINKQQDSMKAVFSPKVQGTWLIDHLTREDKPDFFVICSSLSAVIPSVGQADYIAANSYIDAYAQYRSRFDKNTLVVNWPLWKETGMGFEYGIDEKDEPCKPITTKEGIQRLNEALCMDINRVILFKPNPDFRFPIAIDLLPVKLDSGVLDMIYKLMPKSKGQNTDKKQVCLRGREDGKYTATEMQVASIWSDILGVSELGVHDIFYELGGDSIQAIKIANTINKIMGRNIHAGDVFEHLTVYELSKYIDETGDAPAGPAEADSCEIQDEDREYELSNSQERFWFIQKFDPGIVAYNMSVYRILDFEVDVGLLTRAMQIILKRHPALRTIFREMNGVPKQVVLSKTDFNIEIVDITNCDDEMARLRELIEKENRKPFDLSRLLLRMKLFRLSNKKNCIYFSIHHIIVDGISMGIIEKELFEILTAFSNGTEASLPLLKTSYIDFMLEQKKWLGSPGAAMTEKYWMKELSPPIPVLNLPTDFKRPTDITYNGDYIIVRLDRILADKLKAFAREAGCTMHILLLTIYFALLHKITCDNDIIVGVPITQRDSEELEHVVGPLLNTICIRCDFEGITTFRDLLLYIRDKSIQGYKNSKYPFDLIVSKINPERDRSRNPIYSTLFQYFDNLQMDSESGSMMDISLQCTETEGGIEARFDFNTDLFKRQTAERIGGYFLKIVDQVLDNANTDIAELEIISQAERHKLLEEYNDTRFDYPRELTINELIGAQAVLTPEKAALAFHDKVLTYREFNIYANKLAHRLRKEGVGKGSIVGIMTKRSPDMMIGILGILKAGGAYLPLDPEHPADRIQYMLQDSKACILLTQKHLDDKVRFEGKTVHIDLDSLQEYEDHDPETVNTGEDPAYVIYTSGSTGKPKGVVIRHRSVHNFIRAITDIFAFSHEMTCLCITTMSFDIFVLESLLPFSVGMKVVIADERQQLDPVALSELTAKHRIDIIQTTPSRMQLLLRYQDSRSFLRQARYLFIGGEAFPPVLLEDLKKITKARIINMYGPTETTVWSTYKDLTHENEISIGRPIANTRIYILDTRGRVQPEGVAGELCIAGDGVAAGYLNRPELTAERFVELPFETSGKVYRTGDLAKWLPDGNIAYLGRMDNQVKIRGYRIETGEIESCLLRHAEIKEAAVTMRADEHGDKNLCAYYVSDRELTVNEIKEHLTKELPDYMVPSFFTRLESLPRTANGKLDRRALPKPAVSINTGTGYKAPSTDLERELLDIWIEVLGNKAIGVDHNFFDVGGNSMLLVKLHALLDEKFPGRITIPMLFNYSTISGLAEFLSGQEETSLPKENDDESFENVIYGLFDEMEKGSIDIDEVVQKLVSEGDK